MLVLTCCISRPEGEEVSEENKLVVVQWLRISTANQIAMARALGVTDLEGARTVIQNAMQAVTSTPHVQDDPTVIQLSADLNEVQAGLASTETFRGGAHAMMSYCQQHKMQRFAVVGAAPTAPNVYRGKKQLQMVIAFKLK